MGVGGKISREVGSVEARAGRERPRRARGLPGGPRAGVGGGDAGSPVGVRGSLGDGRLLLLPPALAANPADSTAPAPATPVAGTSAAVAGSAEPGEPGVRGAGRPSADRAFAPAVPGGLGSLAAPLRGGPIA